jgi:MerR family copper efflux transcriptional regulator
MNIGQVAKASGLSAKMIRYYESTGLVPCASRRASGYRVYSESDLHRLMFVRRARELGFSVEFIRELLALWSDRGRSNAEVRAIALKHVADLEAQAEKLQGMIATLRDLIGTCRRGNRPDCPILSNLAGGNAEGSLPLRR